jgi:AraC-like DNA-binding protein
MGPNLPHTWYSPAGVLGQDRFHQAILVQFNEHMGGIDVQKIPECISIQHLFSISSRGLQFYGDTRNLVAKKLSEIKRSEGLNQLLILLSILDLLGKADHSEVEVLSSTEFTRFLQPREQSRIDRVCTFINLNYKEKLTLKDAADIANMSTTAFSRFFKKSTGKTFIRYVNELRIGWACKLLIESEMNIAEICYEVGFNNLSNFNRRFFERHNMSPRIYRQEFTANF